VRRIPPTTEQRFLAKMPLTGDLELHVLKAHLLLEEQLFSIAAAAMQDRQCLLEARLFYWQHYQLAKSVAGSMGHPKSFEFAANLNSIRNAIAHDLDPDSLQQRIRTILKIYPDAFDQEISGTDLNLAIGFGIGAAMAYGGLDGTREAVSIFHARPHDEKKLNAQLQSIIARHRAAAETLPGTQVPQPDPPSPTDRSAGIVSLKALLLVAFIICVLAIGPFFIAFYNNPFSGDPGDWGVFGDYIGGVLGALTPLLAFVALLIQIRQQDRAHLQTEAELRRSIEATNTQLEEARKQSREAQRQNDKDTFFRVLELHYRNAESIYIGVKGREALHKVREVIKDKLDRGGDMMKRSVEIYPELYKAYGNALGHYYRTYYNLLVLVRDTPSLNIPIYRRLVRAPLSEDEVTIMAFNGLDPKNTNMKELIVDFELLFHIDQALIDQVPALLDLYPPKAFGNRFTRPPESE